CRSAADACTRLQRPRPVVVRSQPPASERPLERITNPICLPQCPFEPGLRLCGHDSYSSSNCLPYRVVAVLFAQLPEKRPRCPVLLASSREQIHSDSPDQV